MNILKQFEKATKLVNNKKYPQAIKLLKSLPESREVLLHLGNCYKTLGDDKLAYSYYDSAISAIGIQGLSTTDPYPEALNNMGMIHATYCQDKEALFYFNEAIMHSNNKDTRIGSIWNMSHSMLRMYCDGADMNLATAWWAYDQRIKLKNYNQLFNTKPGLLIWDGKKSIDSITVLHEQGVGDRLMFGRYLRLLKDVVKNVVIQTPADCSIFYKGYETCDNVIDTEYGIAFCSLGRCFIENEIPRGDWLSSLYSHNPSSTFRIGVVATGSNIHGNTEYRDTLLENFSVFSKYGDVYTLNPREHSSMFKNYSNYTWEDTIKALNNVDLVVSVDTSIVHLCGSMGVPCLVLMPYKGSDFRWGSTGMDSVWYDSVKIIRNDCSWPDTFLKAEKYVKSFSTGY